MNRKSFLSTILGVIAAPFVVKAKAKNAMQQIPHEIATWKNLTISPEDMEYLNSVELQREEIARAFGVKKELLSDSPISNLQARSPANIKGRFH